MELINITIKNFRSLKDGTYKLDKLNCISGLNGSGKTSFVKAIWYLLTGNISIQDIKWGEDHVEVEGVINDGQNTTIKRVHYLPDTYMVDGNEVKASAFQKEVEKAWAIVAIGGTKPTLLPKSNPYFTCNDEKFYEFFTTGKVNGARMRGVKDLEVQTASGTILYMRKSMPSQVYVDGRKTSAKAMTQLIEERMGGNFKGLELVTSSSLMNSMSMTEFAKILVSIIPVSIDFDQLSNLANLSNEEEDIFRPLFPKAPAPITVPDVQKVYKELFAARTVINREKEDYLHKSEYNAPMPIMDEAVVKAEVDNLTKELGAVNALKTAHVAYQKAVAERQKALDTLAEWEKELALMPVVGKPSEDAIKALEDMENMLRTNIEGAVVKRSALEQQKRPIEKMLKDLGSTICPLCDKLVCNTDKTACEADLRSSIEMSNKMICDLQDEENRDRVELEKTLAKKQVFLDTAMQYERREALAKRIETLKVSIPAEPVKPADIPNEAEILSKKDKYDRYLKHANVFNECRRFRALADEKEKEYDLYTSCVKKSEPKKGLLTNTILDFILSPFCKHLNTFLQEVHGDIECEFKMDEDGLSLYCKPHRRTGFVRVDDLSTGEKMLVTFALMDMVSSISNSRMLVFDCLENIDRETIESLMPILIKKNIMDRYDHIVLSTVNHPDIMQCIEKYKLFVNQIKLV